MRKSIENIRGKAIGVHLRTNVEAVTFRADGGVDNDGVLDDRSVSKGNVWDTLPVKLTR